MKFITTPLLFLIIPMLASSQVEWTVFGGPQASSAGYKIRDEKQKSSFKYGFQTGVGMKVAFESQLYFAPSIFYSMKGYKVKFTQYQAPPDVTAIDNDTRMHTLETAVPLQLDFSASPSHGFIRTGPTLDFQLFAKEKYHTLSGGTVSRPMKFGYNDYGRYSANWILHLGYESENGLTVFATASIGLASLDNVDEGPDIRHRTFGFCLGWKFHNSRLVMDTRNKE